MTAEALFVFMLLSHLVVLLRSISNNHENVVLESRQSTSLAA